MLNCILVLHQAHLAPDLSEHLAKHPRLVPDLKPLEEELKSNWPFCPSSSTETTEEAVSESDSISSISSSLLQVGKDVLDQILPNSEAKQRPQNSF